MALWRLLPAQTAATASQNTQPLVLNVDALQAREGVPPPIKSMPVSTPLEKWGCKVPLLLLLFALLAALLWFYVMGNAK